MCRNKQKQFQNFEFPFPNTVILQVAISIMNLPTTSFRMEESIVKKLNFKKVCSVIVWLLLFSLQFVEVKGWDETQLN
jgi:hypothetical protein